MAKARKTKVKSKRRNPQTTSKNSSIITRRDIAKDISEQLHLGESYISLILGAIVVLGLSIIFFIFIKQTSFNNPSTIPVETAVPTAQPVSKTYVLQSGEGLWDVAVKFYGDGYRWVDIAKANQLENNADNIEPGTKLIIPNLK